MQQAYGTMNQMLVVLFNHIMRIEEAALTVKGLSIREIHVIEAVCDAAQQQQNTMTDVAARLRITPGSLSVAARTLVNKGYLLRERDQQDKRITRICPTEAALKINQRHQQFHREMIDAIIGQLEPNELDALVSALTRADKYFSTKEQQHP